MLWLTIRIKMQSSRDLLLPIGDSLGREMRSRHGICSDRCGRIYNKRLHVLAHSASHLSRIRVRALFQHFPRERRGNTAALQNLVGLLEAVKGLHRRLVEGAVDRTAVETAVLKSALNPFYNVVPVWLV